MGAFSSSASAKGKSAGARPIAIVLGEIVNRAKDFTNADGAAIAIKDGDAAVTRATTGGIAPDFGVRLSIDGTFAGLALRQGSALHCDDSDTDSRVDAAKCRALQTRSFVVVPIRGGAPDEYVGVLAVFSSQPHAFTRTDLAVLKTTADQVAFELMGAGSEVGPLDSLPAVSTERAPSAPVSAKAVAPPIPHKEPSKDPVATEVVARAAAAATPPAPEKQPEIVPAPEAAILTPKPTAPSAEQPKQQAEAPVAAEKPVVLAPTKPNVLEPPKARVARKEEEIVSLAEAIDQSTIAQRLKDIEAGPKPLPPHAYDEWRGFAFDEQSHEKPNKLLLFGGAAGAAIILVVVAVLGIRSLSSKPKQTSTPATQSTATESTPTTAAAPAATAPTVAPAAATKQARTAEPEVTPKAATPKETPQRVAAVVPTSSAVPMKRVNEPEAAAPQIGMVAASGIALPETKAVVPNAPKIRQSQLETSELIRKVAPKFPMFPPNLPASETVILRATVRTDGSVGQIQVVKGSTAFADAATTAVKQWKYKPAKMDGNPIETNVEVVLNFRK